MNAEKPTAGRGLENNEQPGKNVRVRILLMRHGEKASEEGELTEEGKKRIFEQFQKYELPKDKVKLSSPNVTRNLQTLHIIEKVVGPEKLGNSYVDTALGNVPENLGGIVYEGETDFSERFAERLKSIAIAEGGNVLNQFYIDFESARPDEETLSPQELASKLAKRLLLEAKIAKRLKADSEVDFIHITGSTYLFPLLKEIAEKEISDDPVNAEGNNFVEKLGGELSFGEGIIIEETTDHSGNLSPLRISFRGKEYFIDLKTLQEIATKEVARPKKFKIRDQ